MSQSAHTWNLIVRYHACPQCGYIIESRVDYHYRLGDWIKNLTCPRCQHAFTIKKNYRPKFGPLIGNPQPKEIDWE